MGEAFVQSLARGLAVIRAFDAQHPELSLSDVARRADVTRAAARRFLLTLEELGYVRSDGRAFALTPRVLELGHSYLSALSLPDVAQPHLERLSREVGESASAAVLDGTEVVYVARVPTRRIMSVGITIGTRFPAWATSMGRVLLADLPEDAQRTALESSPPTALTPATIIDESELLAELRRVREQGWALAESQLELGLRSIAVPVRGQSGAARAAVNVSMSAVGSAPDAIQRVLPALTAAAAAIESDLRHV